MHTGLKQLHTGLKQLHTGLKQLHFGLKQLQTTRYAIVFTGGYIYIGFRICKGKLGAK
jgi:X-X-X-Leu-X-X-Gly heptad repeat protein